MRKKPRDYGATRGTVASLRARPIEDIPSGSSEANKARITPGSSPPARSQGPRKVTFGTGTATVLQVDTISTTVKKAQGQGER